MRNTLRWIIFFPIYIVAVSIAQGLAEGVISLCYKWTFPIEGFWDLLIASFLVPFLIAAPVLFFGVVYVGLTYSPNSLIAARVLFPFVFLVYLGNFILDTTAQLGGVWLFLAIEFTVVLLVFCFKRAERSPA